jgi:hypothetical protein
MICQSAQAADSILVSPVHQATTIAACNVANLLNGIPLPIQPHSLIAGSPCAIPAVPVGPLQFLILFYIEFKSSFCHPFIVRLCSIFSISHPLKVRPAMQKPNPFKWRHYQGEIIVLCIRWYVRYSLSYRDLEEMMAERGLTVDHSTMAGSVAKTLRDEFLKKNLAP